MPFQIPAPKTATAGDYEKLITPTFVLPQAYIRHKLEHLDDFNAGSASTYLKSNITTDVKLEYLLTREDEEWLKTHPKVTISEDMTESVINLFELATAFSTPIGFGEAEKLAAEKLNVTKKAFGRSLEEVHSFWLAKRARLRKPLLRRFWPTTATSDTNPNLTFRPREKERYKLRKKRVNDVESFEKLLQLQRDFGKVQNLVELVRRREKLKRISVDLIQDAYEQKVHDLVSGATVTGFKPERVRLVDSSIQLPEVLEITRQPPPPSLEANSMFRGDDAILSIVDNLLVYGDDGQPKKKKKKKRLDEFREDLALFGYEGGDEEFRVKKKKQKAMGAGMLGGAAARAAGAARTQARDAQGGGQEQKALIKRDMSLEEPPLPRYLLPSTLNCRAVRELDDELIFPSEPHISYYLPPPREIFNDFSSPKQAGEAEDVDMEIDELAEGEDENHGQQPPTRFRYRGRLGRGGRIVIDRMPLECAQEQSSGWVNRPPMQHPRLLGLLEQKYIRPSQFPQFPPPPPQLTSSLSRSLPPQAEDWQWEDHATQKVLPNHFIYRLMGDHARYRALNIYQQEDSEDEEVEEVEAAVLLDGQPLMKRANPSGQQEERRVPKFRLVV